MFGLLRTQTHQVPRISGEVLDYIRTEYGRSSVAWYVNEIERQRRRWRRNARPWLAVLRGVRGHGSRPTASGSTGDLETVPESLAADHSPRR